ncbi:MAG: hypothetical protein NTW91_00005 [Verrucomicrobia bacterium]|nr:hypothetical protein [Verrucomicrobiota bacterium]
MAPSYSMQTDREAIESTHSWKTSTTGKPSRIPAPKTGNWVKSFGSWKGFTMMVHRSIGRRLGSGVVTLSRHS